jgi:hypothetical protein
MFHFVPRAIRANEGGRVGMRQDIDISGIPLYYVNRFISNKLDNGDVLLVCGLKCGTDFTPLYAVVTPNSTAMIDGKQYLEAAQEAFNESQLVEGTSH